MSGLENGHWIGGSSQQSPTSIIFKVSLEPTQSLNVTACQIPRVTCYQKFIKKHRKKPSHLGLSKLLKGRRTFPQAAPAEDLIKSCIKQGVRLQELSYSFVLLLWMNKACLVASPAGCKQLICMFGYLVCVYIYT